ncbi:hypothetical protein B566_EDAN004330 [Ephemera danica]|nr:hypothetical protein B566_EDAN004330 [Ephemera danica]
MERHLPKTLSLLTSPPLNSIPLLGYNKVADNTFPNLMPVLMGSSVDEVGEACEWPEKDNWNNNFDTCPLIWNDYAISGFRTMYAEECPHLSTFNFQKGGFGDQPTDYYLRPLLQAAADEIGHTRADNCLLCMGTKSSVDLLLQYTTQFLHRFSSTLRHFAFVWATSLTHDGLNMAGLADKPFHDTIRRTLDHGDLDNTALFFISDHGVRTGEFRLTPQGRMEERLPFLSVSLPAWFRARYATAVRNLETNARARLTTPFDVHETLRDLLTPAKLISDDAIKSRMLKLQTSKSKERTCDDAGIPRHWCTCLSYQPLPLDDPGLQEAAQALVLHINTRFLAAHKQCRKLSLAKIVEARLGVPGKNDNMTVKAGIKDYALTIQTTPGDALFEGAVRGYTHRGRKNINNIRFEVADSISRLNRYGSQSECVEDWVVKLYCYCDKHEEEEQK